MRCALLVLGLGSAWSAGLEAQALLSGIVREDSTRRPLAGVNVVIEGSKRQAVSDSSGRYELVPPSGTHVALFRRLGYHPVRMRVVAGKRDTVQLDAILVREKVVTLEALEVTERAPPPRGSVLAAFEERRRLGLGKFIDSLALRKFEGRRLGDVLRGTGVRIVPFQELIGGVPVPGRTEYRAASPTALDDNGQPCWVSVFLDGVAIYRARSRAMRPPDLNRDINVSSLMAVEYYRGAGQVPMEFGVGRDSDCGVLVLWTRRGP